MKKLFKVIFVVVAIATVSMIFVGCDFKSEVDKIYNQVICEHSYAITDEVASTCAEKGSVTKTCTLCEKEIVEKTELAAHQLVTVPGKDPTCDELGYTESTKCLVCDKVITPAADIPALGHKKESIPGVKATCLMPGISEGLKCSVCDEILVEQKELAALGHNPQFVDAVAPTCSDVGSTSGAKCLNCGEIYSGCAVVPALGHASLDMGEQCSSCGEYKPVDIAEILAGDYDTAAIESDEVIISGTVYRFAKNATIEFSSDEFFVAGSSELLPTLYLSGDSSLNYVGYTCGGSIYDGLMIWPDYNQADNTFTSLLTEEGISHVTGLSIYDDGTYIYIGFYGDVLECDCFFANSQIAEEYADQLQSVNFSSFTYSDKYGDVVRLVY